MAQVEVRDNPERHRYEAEVAGESAGFVDYQLANELMVLTHTEVDRAYEGQGIGSALAQAALDDIRDRGLKALVLCPFVTSWIGRHRDYADVLYGAPPSKVTD